MIPAQAFLDAAAARGLNFYTGVPCSFLTALINRTISSPAMRYVGATNEGEAVALAAGAWLAGRETVIMCQNSGLGNAVNPLTSLNHPFRIPSLFIITWRGQPGIKDEPQHVLMGGITRRMLDTIDVAHCPFPKEPDEIAPTLDAALASMGERQLPFALVMEKSAIASEELDAPAHKPFPPGVYEDRRQHDIRTTRAAALERFLGVAPDQAAIIASTGKCGRELFTLTDRSQHLYQVGSMGCASAMSLGVALHVDRPVAVLDGDGAALMKLGNMATIGATHPANFIHILLDNGVHDSTGGQATVSPAIDFSHVALACGYASATACDDLEGFEAALKAAFAPDAPRGPRLIHMRLLPGSRPNLGRPTVPPHDVARRFRAFLTAS